MRELNAAARRGAVTANRDGGARRLAAEATLAATGTP